MPPEYKTGAIFMLVGSVTTLLASGLWFLWLVLACIGCCWLPLAGLSIWALVCAAQAASGTRVHNIRIANGLAIAASLFTLDIVGFVMQILAMVWFSRPEVASWIERND